LGQAQITFQKTVVIIETPLTKILLSSLKLALDQ
jgi:hypothetical protein